MAGLGPQRHQLNPVTPGFALWALGFRPFYLMAAMFAALAVPLWVLAWGGHVALPMPALWWHAHEMLFGFVVAVVVGFLYTAGRNWTGLPTPSGSALALLAGLWLSGRMALLLSDGVAAAIVDIAFLPAATLALGRVFVRAGNRRNYFILAILGVLALANMAFHGARWQWLPFDPLAALYLALGLIVLLETIMGGRVIPMFTENGIWQASGKPLVIKQLPWLNRAAIAATAIALLLWALDVGAWGAPLALLAAGLQFARSLRWKPWLTLRSPLLWILHLSHLWIPLGLLILAAAQSGWLPRSAAIHAFGIGATAGLIVGMITRTALGHTGRPLVAGRIEFTVYGLVQMAAMVRVLTMAFLPMAAAVGVYIAATAWSLAFVLYVVRYLPWLLRSRPDGRPG